MEGYIDCIDGISFSLRCTNYVDLHNTDRSSIRGILETGYIYYPWYNYPFGYFTSIYFSLLIWELVLAITPGSLLHEEH